MSDAFELLARWECQEVKIILKRIRLESNMAQCHATGWIHGAR